MKAPYLLLIVASAILFGQAEEARAYGWARGSTTYVSGYNPVVSQNCRKQGARIVCVQQTTYYPIYAKAARSCEVQNYNYLQAEEARARALVRQNPNIAVRDIQSNSGRRAVANYENCI